MSKTLHLPLKAKWYEMIEKGLKTEEYRLLSYHWVSRLLLRYDNRRITRNEALDYAFCSNVILDGLSSLRFKLKEFDTVKFSYGYTTRTMIYQIKDIRIGRGNVEWGAPDKDVFIIELGERTE